MQVTENTNGPRPSKTQRLGGAAAAAASRAALGLRRRGDNVCESQQRGRPPTAPVPARLTPALTAPATAVVAHQAADGQPLRDTRSEADAADVEAALAVGDTWAAGGDAAHETSERGGVRGMSPEVRIAFRPSTIQGDSSCELGASSCCPSELILDNSVK